MSKKKKQSEARVDVPEGINSGGAEEHQIEDTNQISEESTPATIVEATEAEVFAGQADGQESPVAASEGDTQREEKPAQKPKISKRQLIAALVTEHLEAGDLDRKELVKLVLARLPEARKGSVETFLTDALNPRYSFYQDRVVTKSPGGKLVFADRLIPGAIAVEQAESTEAHSTEAVSTEEKQPEQPSE